jgi:hypothetical protein
MYSGHSIFLDNSCQKPTASHTDSTEKTDNGGLTMYRNKLVDPQLSPFVSAQSACDRLAHLGERSERACRFP